MSATTILATFESAFETYQAYGVIGEGGAGRVYAVKRSDGTELALKVLHPELSSSDRRKRFKNEMDFLSKDRHPNVIRVLDSGLFKNDKGSAPFYVMPKMPGTLRKTMHAKIASEVVLPIYAQILDGVEAAHLLGVAHRDLKPENILHHPGENRLYVADFGVAHFEEEDLLTAVETKQADRLANFLYAAPEQRIRGGNVDHRADIYALGLLLNEMITGVVPQGSGYQTISSVAPALPYLDALVERMTQHDASRRYASIAEVKRELQLRKNEFITQQRLDAKKREVVRAHAPEEPVPVELLGVDWDGEHLAFTLNRAPEPGWIERFGQPRDGWSGVMGRGPDRFQFRGDKAFIDAAEHQVEPISKHFPTYLDSANRGYREDLQVAARRREHEDRERLRREQERAEAIARVAKKLRP